MAQRSILSLCTWTQCTWRHTSINTINKTSVVHFLTRGIKVCFHQQLHIFLRERYTTHVQTSPKLELRDKTRFQVVKILEKLIDSSSFVKYKGSYSILQLIQIRFESIWIEALFLRIIKHIPSCFVHFVFCCSKKITVNEPSVHRFYRYDFAAFSKQRLFCRE